MAPLGGSSESIAMSNRQLVLPEREQDNTTDQEALSRDQINLEAMIPRVDLRVMPLLVLSLFLTSFDKGRIYHTRRRNLKFYLLDYGQAAVFGSRMAAVVPAVLISGTPAVKPLGATLVLWGIVTACSAAARSHAAILACQILAAMLETMTLPFLIGSLSQWFGTSKHSARIAFCWCGMIAGQSLGNLLAMCIDFEKDRWWALPLSFGISTSVVGAAIVLFVPEHPQKATWGFLKEGERKAAISQGTSSDGSTLNPKSVLSDIVPIALDEQIWAFIFLVCVLSFTSTLPRLGLHLGLSTALELERQTSTVSMLAVLIIGHGIASTGNEWAWVTAVSCFGLIGSAAAIQWFKLNFATFVVVEYLLYTGDAAMLGVIIWISTKVSSRIGRTFLFAVIEALAHLEDVFSLDVSDPKSSALVNLGCFAAVAVFSVCQWALYERKEAKANTQIQEEL